MCLFYFYNLVLLNSHFKFVSIFLMIEFYLLYARVFEAIYYLLYI